MSEISINTTQNVNIFFNVASIGARLGAYLIDLVMKIFYIIFIQWAFISNMGLGNLNLDTWSEMSIYIIFYLPVTFYSIVQESLMEGQTIGQKVCSIKVVKIDGYQASFTDYLTRWVFRLVDVTGSLCVAGAISMFASPRHQRLGDIAAGTAVISLKNDINISHTLRRRHRAPRAAARPRLLKVRGCGMPAAGWAFQTVADAARCRSVSSLLE